MSKKCANCFNGRKREYQQKLVLRRNSINKHKAVHVSHNNVVEPWAGTFNRIDNPDILACTSWRTERNIFEIALVKVEQVDEGKTVTGTMFEVHWHANKVELTADSQVGEWKRFGKLHMKIGWPKEVDTKMPVAMQALLKVVLPIQDLRSNGQYDTRTPRITNSLLSTKRGHTSGNEPMINRIMESETQNLPTSPYPHTIARCSPHCNKNTSAQR